MSLKIYPEALPDNPYSQDSDMTNPLREAFDGRNGGSRETKYYIRNDDSDYRYTDVQLEPIDSAGRNIVGGVDGYGWKLKVGDTQPTQDEWDSISYGNSITFSDILDIATYLPFWIRMEVPRGAPVESHEDVVFRTSATEILV